MYIIFGLMVFSAVQFLAFQQNILAFSFLHFRPTGFDPTDQTRVMASFMYL